MSDHVTSPYSSEGVATTTNRCTLATITTTSGIETGTERNYGSNSLTEAPAPMLKCKSLRGVSDSLIPYLLLTTMSPQNVAPFSHTKDEATNRQATRQRRAQVYSREAYARLSPQHVTADPSHSQHLKVQSTETQQSKINILLIQAIINQHNMAGKLFACIALILLHALSLFCAQLLLISYNMNMQYMLSA